MHALALTITAKRLAEFCESRQLSAVHLAGELNVNAGGESRADCDAISDWKLDTSVFSLINEIWPSDTDLFSSAWNAQLPSFFSWLPQPGAERLCSQLERLFRLRFPPFSLIFKCLEKVVKEEANIVFVCPV